MENEYHWRDGWTFTRKDNGVRIRNEACCVDITIPFTEWLSILKATDTMKDALFEALRDHPR